MKEFPTRVNVMLTGECNLRCPYCWGPNHSIKDGLNLDQWFIIVASLHNKGMTNLVISGGEPFMWPDLTMLMLAACALGFNNTLSTNCTLLADNLKDKPNVLSFTHEIGIPIDGSTPEINGRLRPGDDKTLEATLSALSLLNSEYRHIHTTVRTVITQQNIDDVRNIGKLLTPNPPNRWKLYEFTPIEYGLVNNIRLRVDPDKFEKAVRVAQITYPTLRIETQRTSRQAEKYLFIGPGGDFYSIGQNLEPIPFGNPLEIGEKVMGRISKHFAELK